MKNSKELSKFKRQLRSNITPSEKYVLMRLNELGVEVKFQLILGFYILDFVIPDRMLNIEVDGASHYGRQRYDSIRDAFVDKCGFRVIRIKNGDIYDFDYKSILKLPRYDLRLFRRGLSLANVYRGKEILRQRSLVIM